MYWFIVAVVLFVAELFLGTFYLLVVSASLVSAGLSQWLLHTPLLVNMAVASLFSIIGIVLVRQWQKKHSSASGHNSADDPDNHQLVILEQALHGGLWLVRYRGTQWQARFAADDHQAKSGDSARIHGKNGNVLLLESPSHTS